MTLDEKINNRLNTIDQNCLGWIEGYKLFSEKFARTVERSGFLFTNSGKLVYLKVRNINGNHLQACNAPSFREWSMCDLD